MFRSKPYLELRIQGSRPRRYRIEKVPFAVGSARDGDLIIEHPDIDSRQFVIDETNGKWTIEATGFNRVAVNTLELSAQSLETGDVIALQDDIELTFVDPVQEKAMAADSDRRRKKESEQSDTQPARPRYLVPALVFSVMTTIMIGVSALVAGDDETDLPDFRNNTPNAVRVALDGTATAGGVLPDSLGRCIIDANRRGSLSAWARASQTPFWTLAQSYTDASQLEQLLDDIRYVELRQDLLQNFWDARQDETRGHYDKARLTYENIIRMVPDAKCWVHLIAAARLNAI